MKLKFALPFLLLFSMLVAAQTQTQRDSYTITSNPTTVTFYDTIGAQTNQWEYLITGAPATVSIANTGQMRGGSTCVATNTYTTVANTVVTTNGACDKWVFVVSWTGGTSVNIVVNRLGTQARSSASGGTSFGSITAGTNTAALLEGSGGSLSGTGIGQVAGTQIQLRAGPITPVLSFSATGGNIASNHTIWVRLSWCTAGVPGVSCANQTYAGTAGSIANTGCTGGNQCSTTITAPTLPAGVVGYNVYDCDATTECAELLQAAANVCVDVTANCVIQTPGAGAALPTVNTSWIQPSVLNTNTCPPATIPTVFGQLSDNTWDTVAGMDTADTSSGGHVAPFGTFTFCKALWILDTKVSPPPGGKNALVVINHNTGTNTIITNQDRALWVSAANPAVDSNTHKSITAIQAEIDINGTPVFGPGPDAEISAGSFQTADSHTGNTAGPNYNNTIRAQYFREAGAGTYSGGLQGSVLAIASNLSTVSGGSQQMSAVTAKCDEQTGSAAAILCVGYFLAGNSGTFTNMWGVYLSDTGSAASQINFESATANSTQGKNFFDGSTFLNHVTTTGPNRNVAAPTSCASTGTGTGPSCAFDTGSNDSSGTATVTAGTTPSGLGTITLTYQATLGSNSSTCIGMLSNAGTGAWNIRATVIGGTMNTTSAVFNWDNNSVNLTAASTYKLNYNCWGK